MSLVCDPQAIVVFLPFFQFFAVFFIKNGKIKTAIENKRQIKTAESEIFKKNGKKKNGKNQHEKKNGKKNGKKKWQNKKLKNK